jgi:hypothetical protein
MTRRAVLGLLLLLAACQGNDSKQEAAATTTSTSSTTTSTTTPDPVAEGCKAFDENFPAGINLLRISRNERIAEAAKEYDETDTLDADITDDLKAMQEVRYACQAAGYLPR